jgi:hypothetical protein
MTSILSFWGETGGDSRQVRESFLTQPYYRSGRATRIPESLRYRAR